MRRGRADRPARPGRPAHPPARAGPGGRRDGRDRHRGGRARRLHRGPRDGQHRAGRRHGRRGRAGLAARPPGRAGATCSPVGAVTAGLAGEPAGRARRDGRLRGPGAGVLRRRPVRVRRRADAPGAGVRQGVRRGDRPARPGAAADRGRAGERGRGRPAGSGLAGWPAVAEEAIIARDCLLAAHVGSRAARLPRVDGRLGGDHPLGQVQGLAGHRRGHPAPPAAHRRAGAPATTRSTRSTRRCAPAPTSPRCAPGLADGTIDCVATDHAPHPAEDKETEWAAAAFGMTGPGDGAAGRARGHGRAPACSTGRASPTGCRSARPRSAGSARSLAGQRPLPDRGRRRRPTCVLVRPGGRSGTVDPAAHASRSRNTPVRRDEAARPGGRDVPARHADRARREAGPMTAHGAGGHERPRAAGARGRHGRSAAPASARTARRSARRCSTPA